MSVSYFAIPLLTRFLKYALRVLTVNLLAMTKKMVQQVLAKQGVFLAPPGKEVVATVVDRHIPTF